VSTSVVLLSSSCRTAALGGVVICEGGWVVLCGMGASVCCGVLGSMATARTPTPKAAATSRAAMDNIRLEGITKREYNRSQARTRPEVKTETENPKHEKESRQGGREETGQFSKRTAHNLISRGHYCYFFDYGERAVGRPLTARLSQRSDGRAHSPGLDKTNRPGPAHPALVWIDSRVDRLTTIRTGVEARPGRIRLCDQWAGRVGASSLAGAESASGQKGKAEAFAELLGGV
jgi:hypothetical protein